MTDEELDALVKRMESVSLQVAAPSRTILDSDVIRKAAAALTALRAQLAEVQADLTFMTENRNKWQDSATQRWFRLEEANARADRAEVLISECAVYLKDNETPRQRMDRDHADILGLMKLLANEKMKSKAALAAQIEADAKIADLCERQNGPLSLKGKDPYVQGLSSAGQAIAAAIRNQPHDRTALDRLLADAEAKAMRRAVAKIRPSLPSSGNGIVIAALHREADAIEAMIPKDTTP